MRITKKPEERLRPSIVLNFEHWDFDMVSDFRFRYSDFDFSHNSELPKSTTELMGRLTGIGLSM